MRRRSRAGGEATKARRRKTAARKRRIAPKATRPRSSAREETKVARLIRELNEAVEQQTAAAEILRVISSSPGDLQPVFKAILESATRICEAKFGNLWLCEADKFRIVAIHGGSAEYREYLFAEPVVALDARDSEHDPRIVALVETAGISPEVREKLFNPFFTTKPAGEGTGLGLSISHDIIVKQHSGAIEVDSQLGDYTEVRIVLPRAAAFTPGR